MKLKNTFLSIMIVEIIASANFTPLKTMDLAPVTTVLNELRDIEKLSFLYMEILGFYNKVNNLNHKSSFFELLQLKKEGETFKERLNDLNVTDSEKNGCQTMLDDSKRKINKLICCCCWNKKGLIACTALSCYCLYNSCNIL